MTTLLSIVATHPDTVKSPLSSSEKVGIACIASYMSFFVGTSFDPFHPAPYVSGGTIISQVKVPPDFSILSVLRAEKLSLNFVMSVQAGVSDVDSVAIVDILYRSSYGIRCRVNSCIVVS